MAVDSNSTLSQVQAEYADCASYDLDRSVDKAKRFVVACRILLLKLPAETGTREVHTRLSPERIQQELDEAREWIKANAAGPTSGNPSVTRVSFEQFR